MVKRISLWGLFFSFLCLFARPVLADETGYIIDPIGRVTQSQFGDFSRSFMEEVLEEEAVSIAETYQFQVYFAVADSDVEDLDTYAKELYQERAGDAGGVIMVVSEYKYKWAIYYGGQGKERIQVEDLLLWGTFNDGYDPKEHELWTSLQVRLAINRETDGYESKEVETHNIFWSWENGVASFYRTIRSRLEKPSLLVDRANLLDSEQYGSLLDKINKISQRQGMDVVILTERDLYWKTPVQYADDYFDYNGYGQGPQRDGILLLVSVGERDWHISTTGYGITAFTDVGLTYLSKKFLKDLSAGNYDKAFHAYLDTVDAMITQAKEGKPYDTGTIPKEPFNPWWLLVTGIFGPAIAFARLGFEKQKLKSVRGQMDASAYLVNNSFRMTASQDIFLYRTVHKQRMDFDSSSSSGGKSGRSGFSSRSRSGTHSSSSGSRHGGMGGKF